MNERFVWIDSEGELKKTKPYAKADIFESTVYEKILSICDECRRQWHPQSGCFMNESHYGKNMHNIRSDTRASSYVFLPCRCSVSAFGLNYFMICGMEIPHNLRFLWIFFHPVYCRSLRQRNEFQISFGKKCKRPRLATLELKDTQVHAAEKQQYERKGNGCSM